MPPICQTFVQNTWRKDICSNCFRTEDEHGFSPTNTTSRLPRSISGYDSSCSSDSSTAHCSRRKHPITSTILGSGRPDGRKGERALSESKYSLKNSLTSESPCKTSPRYVGVANTRIGYPRSYHGGTGVPLSTSTAWKSRLGDVSEVSGLKSPTLLLRNENIEDSPSGLRSPGLIKGIAASTSSSSTGSCSDTSTCDLDIKSLSYDGSSSIEKGSTENSSSSYSPESDVSSNGTAPKHTSSQRCRDISRSEILNSTVVEKNKRNQAISYKQFKENQLIFSNQFPCTNLNRCTTRSFLTAGDNNVHDLEASCKRLLSSNMNISQEIYSDSGEIAKRSISVDNLLKEANIYGLRINHGSTRSDGSRCSVSPVRNNTVGHLENTQEHNSPKYALTDFSQNEIIETKNNKDISCDLAKYMDDQSRNPLRCHDASEFSDDDSCADSASSEANSTDSEQHCEMSYDVQTSKEKHDLPPFLTSDNHSESNDDCSPKSSIALELEKNQSECKMDISKGIPKMGSKSISFDLSEEIIGYGGDVDYSDCEDFFNEDGVDDDDDSDTCAELTLKERLLKRLTLENTDFNAENDNLTNDTALPENHVNLLKKYEEACNNCDVLDDIPERDSRVNNINSAKSSPRSSVKDEKLVEVEKLESAKIKLKRSTPLSSVKPFVPRNFVNTADSLKVNPVLPMKNGEVVLTRSDGTSCADKEIIPMAGIKPKYVSCEEEIIENDFDLDMSTTFNEKSSGKITSFGAQENTENVIVGRTSDVSPPVKNNIPSKTSEADNYKNNEISEPIPVVKPARQKKNKLTGVLPVSSKPSAVDCKTSDIRTDSVICPKPHMDLIVGNSEVLDEKANYSSNIENRDVLDKTHLNKDDGYSDDNFNTKDYMSPPTQIKSPTNLNKSVNSSCLRRSSFMASQLGITEVLDPNIISDEHFGIRNSVSSPKSSENASENTSIPSTGYLSTTATDHFKKLHLTNLLENKDGCSETVNSFNDNDDAKSSSSSDTNKDIASDRSTHSYTSQKSSNSGALASFSTQTAEEIYYVSSKSNTKLNTVEPSVSEIPIGYNSSESFLRDIKAPVDLHLPTAGIQKSVYYSTSACLKGLPTVSKPVCVPRPPTLRQVSSESSFSALASSGFIRNLSSTFATMSARGEESRESKTVDKNGQFIAGKSEEVVYDLPVIVTRDSSKASTASLHYSSSSVLHSPIEISETNTQNLINREAENVYHDIPLQDDTGLVTSNINVDDNPPKEEFEAKRLFLSSTFKKEMLSPQIKNEDEIREQQCAVLHEQDSSDACGITVNEILRKQKEDQCSSKLSSGQMQLPDILNHPNLTPATPKSTISGRPTDVDSYSSFTDDFDDDEDDSPNHHTKNKLGDANCKKESDTQQIILSEMNLTRIGGRSSSATPLFRNSVGPSTVQATGVRKHTRPAVFLTLRPNKKEKVKERSHSCPRNSYHEVSRESDSHSKLSNRESDSHSKLSKFAHVTSNLFRSTSPQPSKAGSAVSTAAALASRGRDRTKKAFSRFSLKKFLKIGSSESKEDARGEEKRIKEAIKQAEREVRKSKLNIIHPLDYNTSAVEVIARPEKASPVHGNTGHYGFPITNTPPIDTPKTGDKIEPLTESGQQTPIAGALTSNTDAKSTCDFRSQKELVKTIQSENKQQDAVVVIEKETNSKPVQCDVVLPMMTTRSKSDLSPLSLLSKSTKSQVPLRKGLRRQSHVSEQPAGLPDEPDSSDPGVPASREIPGDSVNNSEVPRSERSSPLQPFTLTPVAAVSTTATLVKLWRNTSFTAAPETRLERRASSAGDTRLLSGFGINSEGRPKPPPPPRKTSLEQPPSTHQQSRRHSTEDAQQRGLTTPYLVPPTTSVNTNCNVTPNNANNPEYLKTVEEMSELMSKECRPVPPPVPTTKPKVLLTSSGTSVPSPPVPVNKVTQKTNSRNGKKLTRQSNFDKTTSLEFHEHNSTGSNRPAPPKPVMTNKNQNENSIIENCAVEKMVVQNDKFACRPSKPLTKASSALNNSPQGGTSLGDQNCVKMPSAAMCGVGLSPIRPKAPPILPIRTYPCVKNGQIALQSSCLPLRDSAYANLGDVRAPFTPRKPGRTTGIKADEAPTTVVLGYVRTSLENTASKRIANSVCTGKPMVKRPRVTLGVQQLMRSYHQSQTHSKSILSVSCQSKSASHIHQSSSNKHKTHFDKLADLHQTATRKVVKDKETVTTSHSIMCNSVSSLELHSLAGKKRSLQDSLLPSSLFSETENVVVPRCLEAWLRESIEQGWGQEDDDPEPCQHLPLKSASLESPLTVERIYETAFHKSVITTRLTGCNKRGKKSKKLSSKKIAVKDVHSGNEPSLVMNCVKELNAANSLNECKEKLGKQSLYGVSNSCYNSPTDKYADQNSEPFRTNSENNGRECDYANCSFCSVCCVDRNNLDDNLLGNGVSGGVVWCKKCNQNMNLCKCSFDEEHDYETVDTAFFSSDNRMNHVKECLFRKFAICSNHFDDNKENCMHGVDTIKKLALKKFIKRKQPKKNKSITVGKSYYRVRRAYSSLSLPESSITNVQTVQKPMNRRHTFKENIRLSSYALHQSTCVESLKNIPLHSTDTKSIDEGSVVRTNLRVPCSPTLHCSQSEIPSSISSHFCRNSKSSRPPSKFVPANHRINLTPRQKHGLLSPSQVDKTLLDKHGKKKAAIVRPTPRKNPKTSVQDKIIKHSGVELGKMNRLEAKKDSVADHNRITMLQHCLINKKELNIRIKSSKNSPVSVCRPFLWSKEACSDKNTYKQTRNHQPTQSDEIGYSSQMRVFSNRNFDNLPCGKEMCDKSDASVATVKSLDSFVARHTQDIDPYAALSDTRPVVPGKTSVEPLYGTPAAATHDALSKLFDQLSAATPVVAAPYVSVARDTRSWQDVAMLADAPPVKSGLRMYQPGLVRGVEVTVLLTPEPSLLPHHLFGPHPLVVLKEARVAGTVWVLPRTSLRSLTQYHAALCQRRREFTSNCNDFCVPETCAALREQRELALVLLQLVAACKQLQVQGTEELSLDMLMLALPDGDDDELLSKYSSVVPRLVVAAPAPACPFPLPHPTSTLCQIAVAAAECLGTTLSHVGAHKLAAVFGATVAVLRQERAGSLTKAQCLLEAFVFGCEASVSGENSHDLSEVRLQKWLDDQRTSLLLHFTSHCNGGQQHSDQTLEEISNERFQFVNSDGSKFYKSLTLEDKFKLIFLVRTNARSLAQSLDLIKC